MLNRIAPLLASAAFALSGVTLSQAAAAPPPAGSSATDASAPGSAPVDRRLRTRVKPAARDAANASGRDLSDGAVPAGAAAVSPPSSKSNASNPGRYSGGASRRDGANSTGRDLSDGDPQSATAAAPAARPASGSKRERRRVGARVGDTSNSPARDLSDSSFPPSASGVSRK